MRRVQWLCPVVTLAGILFSGCVDSSGDATFSPPMLACQAKLAIAGPTAMSNAHSLACGLSPWVPEHQMMLFNVNIGAINEHPDQTFQLQIGVWTPNGAIDVSSQSTAYFALASVEGGVNMRWKSPDSACVVTFDEVVAVMDGENFAGRNVRLHGSCTQSAAPVVGNPDPRELILNNFELEGCAAGWM